MYVYVWQCCSRGLLLCVQQICFGSDPFNFRFWTIFIFHSCFAYGYFADVIIISTISSKCCWLINLATSYRTRLWLVKEPQRC